MCYHIWQLLLSLSLSLSIRTSSILLQPLFLILLPSWAAYFFHSIFFFSSYRFSFSSFLYLLVCNSISVFSSSPSFLFVTISFSLISSQFLVLSLSPSLSLSLSLSPPPSLSLSVQLWAPPYVSIAIGKWNPWWSRCHGDSLHSLTSAHLTSPLALSLSVCLSFSSTCFHLSSLLLLRPDQNGVEESQASSSQPHIWTQHAFSFLLSFFSSVRFLRSSTILSELLSFPPLFLSFLSSIAPVLGLFLTIPPPRSVLPFFLLSDSWTPF